MRHDTRMLIGSICWLAGLQWFVAQAVTQAAWTTPYSLSRNTLSDLGATRCFSEPVSLLNPSSTYICSPLHSLMNASYVLFGLLILGGVILLWDRWPRRRTVVAGMILLALFAIAKVVIGLAPEDQNLKLHALGTLGMLCGDVGALLLGAGLWRTVRWQAVVFLLIGIVGVPAFFLQLLPHLAAIRGALERVADWPLPFWLAILGGLGLLRRWWPRLDRVPGMSPPGYHGHWNPTSAGRAGHDR